MNEINKNMKIDNDDIGDFMKMAEMFLANDAHEHAVMYLNLILKIDPGSVEASQRLSNLNIAAETVNDGLYVDSQVGGTGSRNDRARRERGLIKEGELFLNKGDIVSAVMSFEKVLQINKLSQDAYLWLSLCSRRKMDMESAVRYLDRVLLINPVNAEAYNQKGIIFFESADFEQAKSLFVYAMKLDPGSVEIRRNYGDVLLILKEYDEAFEIFFDLVNDDVRDVSALLNLAKIYAAVNRMDDCVEAVGMIMKIEPDNIEAANLLKTITKR